MSKRMKHHPWSLQVGATAITVMLTTAACQPAPAAPVTAAVTPTPQVTLSGPVTLTSARPLTEVVADEDPWFAALSPDGAHIAYYKDVGRGSDRKGQVCIYTFATAAKACHDLSREVFVGFPYQLQWSPDSAMVAFSENPVELGNESDIWLLKVADGSFTNLTDDGLAQGWRAPVGAAEGAVVNIDYLPAWSAADGKIYFWRARPAPDMRFDLGLYRIAPTGGEPERVRDVSVPPPQRLPLYKQEGMFLDGPSALSPDGGNLAVLLSSLDEFGGLQTSLWLIGLADAGVAPRELITPGGFSVALPEWQNFPAYPTGLTWTADGKSVVTSARSDDANTPFVLFYATDVESGATTPVVDFSSLPDRDAYYAIAPGNELPARYFSAESGSLSPQGDKLLMLSNLAGVVGLLTEVLPPDSALPHVSALAEVTTLSSATRASRSKDGKVLLYGALLTVEE